MTKGFQSPVNLNYRLESLTKSLAKLEAHPRTEAENEARRLVALLRASSEFRGMESLLQAAQITELAPSKSFPDKLRDLISEIQKAITQSPGNNGIILLVSSDKDYTSYLSGKLTDLNHQTVIADSPQRAKEFIALSCVSFCIIDVVLADMDGRAFILELRSHPETAALPIIAITPESTGAKHPPFHVPGADSIFSKQASLDDIANYMALRLKRSYVKGLQARRDQSTGLPNRAACHEIFRQLQNSIEENDPMAFVLVGIHQFAAITSHCTPLACETLVRKIGAILSSSLRATDVVARWDEAEFAILLTGEDHFGATKALEKVLPDLSDLTITSSSGESIPISICIGITINNSRTSIEDAALRAESHLYMAFSDADTPEGGKRIVSDAIPLSHREDPIAICLTNEGMAKIIKQILERETFKAEIFTDIESVFKRIISASFSLLILDDELPEDSGFTLLQRLNEQANFSNMSTMMMVSQKESIERVMKLGAKDYFMKPPTMPAFLGQIRRVISHTSQQQPGSGITIMVADHELPQLLLAGTTLHQLGTCQILLAKGAADALQRLKNAHPEYLILAQRMPHISTAEFANQLKHMEWLKNTKVILASENPSAPLPKSEGALFYGIISRPFKPATLLAELQQLIPALPKSIKGRVPTDPRLLELEVQRILALSS